MRLNNNNALKLTALLSMVPLFGFQTAKVKAKQATAPVPALPVVKLTTANTTVLHSSSTAILILASATYAAGVRSVGLSGPGAGTTGYFPNGYPSAMAALYFYPSFHPAGDYTFTATVTGDDGKIGTASLVIHDK